MRWARTKEDYEAANAIINHPAVLPYHFVDGTPVQPLDLSKQLWVALEDGKACWLFIPYGRVFEAHTSVLPEWRQDSLELTRAARDFVFETTPVLEVTSFSPRTNKPAIRLALEAGMIESGADDQYKYFSIQRGEWETIKCQQPSLY
jgi:hypothetical protein